MKKIKKTLLALLVLVAAFAATACTNKDDTENGTTDKDNIATTVENSIKKGVDNVEDAIEGTTK